MQQKQISLFIIIFLIAATVLVVYSNSFSNAFVIDDQPEILTNSSLRHWDNLPRLFRQSLAPDLGIGVTAYYRPVKALTFMLDYHFWYLNPFGYHLTNTILHILASILVYFFIQGLFQKQYLSLITAVLFAVHPIHVEAVTYISGRADSLAAIFSLGCLISYLKFRQKSPADKNLKIAYYLISLFCFGLALFTKVSVMVLPLGIVLLEAVCTKYSGCKPIDNKKKLIYLLWFILIIAVYLIFRIKVLELFKGAYFSLTLPWPRFLTFSKIFFIYLGLLIFPHNLHAFRTPTWSHTFFDPLVIMSILGLAVIALFALKSYRKYPLVYFAVFWFFIFLLPQANIVFSIFAPICDHFLYLPSIGFFILIALGIDYLLSRKLARARLVSLLLLVYVVFLGFTTYQTNYKWKDINAIVENTLKYSPNSYFVRIYLGAIHANQGRLDEAIREFQIVEQLSPNHPAANVNLAMLYTLKGETELAEEYYEKVKAGNPFNFHYRICMANIYLSVGKIDKALAEFEFIYQVSPNNLDALFSLAKIHHHKGELDKAIVYYEKVLKIDPRYQSAFWDLGFAYAKKGDFAAAEQLFREAVRLWPKEARAYYFLGRFYWEKNEIDKAALNWRKTLELRPDDIILRKWLEDIKEKD